MESYKPPTVGPSAGPRKIEANSRLEAGTRVAASHKSANRPPQLFNGAHAKNPHKKRVTSTAAMFCARLWPKWNRVYAINAGMSTALLPYNSEPGPQNIGDGTYPRRNADVTK